MGNSCFSPNMKLMGQSLADRAGTYGARKKCPSILRSSAPDRAEILSVKAQLARRLQRLAGKRRGPSEPSGLWTLDSRGGLMTALSPFSYSHLLYKPLSSSGPGFLRSQRGRWNQPLETTVLLSLKDTSDCISSHQLLLTPMVAPRIGVALSLGPGFMEKGPWSWAAACSVIETVGWLPGWALSLGCTPPVIGTHSQSLDSWKSTWCSHGHSPRLSPAQHLLSSETQIQSQVDLRTFPSNQSLIIPPAGVLFRSIHQRHLCGRFGFIMEAGSGSSQRDSLPGWHCGKGRGLVGGSGLLEFLTGYLCPTMLQYGPKSHGAKG